MTGRITAFALLSATILASATPALAQSQGDLAAELAAMRERIQQLEARLAEREAAAAAAPAPAPAAPAQPAAAASPAPASPSWRGAPQFTGPSGWSFKPRGRIQYDAGSVSSPDGIEDRGLGFSNELRRARIGVEGTMPGGFGYVLEADVATGEVELADAYLSYKASPEVGLVIGQHNNFQSLEEVTSSRFTTFIERAAFTDAFNFERRLGLSATYTGGDFLAQGGVFTDNVGDLDNDENDSTSFDARLVYAPKSGETQLHFGGSAHYRMSGTLAETGNTTRYRQRPLIHSTDTRFIGTPALRVENETHYGLEAAMISGPFHAAAEVHWLNADAISPERSPNLFGGYAELGYYLTGETRGYRNGRFDRTTVRRPVGQNGGLGAFQLNFRYDHLDLNSGNIVGGRQNGYQAALIWIPQDYVRFMINYAHLSYDDAATAAAGGERDYGVSVIGARAQIDF
jgi:phosphate-selective porin OprO/OprP